MKKYLWIGLYAGAFAFISIQSKAPLAENFGFWLFGVAASILVSFLIFGAVKLISKKPLDLGLILSVGACIMLAAMFLQLGLARYISSQKQSSAPPSDAPRAVPSVYVEIPAVVLDYTDQNRKEWQLRVGFTIELKDKSQFDAVYALRTSISQEVERIAKNYDIDYLKTPTGKAELSSDVLTAANKATGIEASRALITSFNYISN
ncbi:flagellar basal body-associated FliL family protein [Acidovorax temperans]|uniref:flagellar basal body-associated FliL family protein n=1 Tax=Acidovorax temperans TaxID=80878 RepID=UPI0023587F6F|nr:flagellar basal body-associated FliL family protein [Acidovorax temperans]WCT26649.1 flagellar basal body-associated FliL family protein [Acidovorax temperans]